MSVWGEGKSSFSVVRFNEAAAEAGTRLGMRVHALGSTRSTNEVAMALTRRGSGNGTVVVADEQTRGRGRNGQPWHSTKDGSLTFSLVMRPSLATVDLLRLPLIVGVALYEALVPHVKASLRIKWPNDLICDGKKLAGILAESRYMGADLEAAVIGIGLNLNVEQAPDEIRALAIGLNEAGAEPASKEVWLARILAKLEAELRRFKREGFGPALGRLRELDALIGSTLQVHNLRGVARGIDATGALLIEDEWRKIHAITSGSLEVMSPAPQNGKPPAQAASSDTRSSALEATMSDSSEPSKS